jgi:hypothetical protein
MSDDLIAELAEELKKGRIYEATLITDDGAHLEGISDPNDGTVTIDPKVSIVSVLLHELIHRRHPDWCEARVRRTEKLALQHLSPQDIQTWYRRYKRVVRKRRPVDALNYEG